MNKRDRLLLLSTIYLLSMCVISFEVALSRVLAAATGYHMAFLAVSLTIFGLGSGGFILFLLRKSKKEALLGAKPAIFSAIALPFSFIIFASLIVYTGVSNSWIPFLTVTLLPFIFAGIVLSHIFRSWAEKSSHLYAFDLIGASMGCLLVILLLHFLNGGINTILAIAALSCLPAFLLATLSNSGKAAKIPIIVAMLISLALLIASYNGKALKLDPLSFNGISEFVAKMKASGEDPIFEKRISFWDEFSRVDVINYQSTKNRYKHIFINGRTPANMVGFGGDPKEIQYLQKMPGFIAFKTGKTDNVCCIGAGGGVDILVSLLGGAKNIDAVEINPAVVKTTIEDGEFNGRVFQFDKVNLHVDDGRSFLAKTKNENYDVIYLALVQSITGDFSDLAFVEDYLYTLEASDSYFSHLKAGGRLVMTTHNRNLLYRYLATAAQMLLDRGFSKEESLSRLASFSLPAGGGNTYFVTLLFKDKISKELASFTNNYIKNIGGETIHIPGIKADEILKEFVNSDGFLFTGGTDISPCVDDKPFFFRLAPGFILMMQQIWGAVLLANILLVMFLWKSRKSFSSNDKSLKLFIAYFMIIGINYTLVQIALMQKSILFLGYPTLSLSVVLFTMLLGSGLGSFVSSKIENDNLLKYSKLALLGITIFGFLLAFALGPLYRELMYLDVGLKMLLVSVILFPISFLLGMPMPLGLRACSKDLQEGIPYFWGLNGSASVLGSLSATVIAMSRGFSTAWLAAISLTLILILIIERSEKSSKKQQ